MEVWFALKKGRVNPYWYQCFAVEEKGKEYYTPEELKEQLKRDYGKQKWGRAMIKGVFDNW